MPKKKRELNMKILLKGLNPFICLFNVASMLAHIERSPSTNYKPYDFSKDIKYF